MTTSVDRMPVPGDSVPNFVFADPDRCWRMIYDRNLQAARRRGAVEWYGSDSHPRVNGGGEWRPALRIWTGLQV